MRIFNQDIFYSDADYFMGLSCSDKKKWIKANTNQQSDEAISDFLKTLRRSSDDECNDCKNKKANVISKGVSKKVAAATESKGDTIDSGSGNNKKTRRSIRLKGG